MQILKIQFKYIYVRLHDYFLPAVFFIFTQNAFPQPKVFQNLNIWSGLSASKTVNSDEIKIKYDSGIRLNTSLLDLTLSTGTNNFSLENPAAGQKYRYGTQLHLNSKYFPFNIEVFAGTLKYSASYSRLKSPLIPSFSPLKTAVLLPWGTSPSMPGFTGTPAEISAAVTISPGMKTKSFPEFQAAVIPQKEFFFSINKTFSIPRTGSLNAGFTGGVFKHGQKTTSQWYFKKLPYKHDFYSAGELLFNFTAPVWRSSAACAFYENPFGGIRSSLRLTNSLLLENFTLNTIILLADADLISADGSMPHTEFQFKINPQYKLYLRHCWFNSGIVFEKNFPEMKKLSSFSLSEANLKCAIICYLKKISTGFYFSPGQSYKVTAVIPAAKIKNCFSFQYKTAETKKNFSISHSLKSPLPFISSAGFSADFEKADTVRKKFSSYIQFAFSSKRIKCSGKLSLNLNL